MQKPTISLQPSEQGLLAAATRIYAAYIVSGQVGEGQEEGWRARAIREAVWIAQELDESVAADDEIRS